MLTVSTSESSPTMAPLNMAANDLERSSELFTMQYDAIFHKPYGIDELMRCICLSIKSTYNLIVRS